MIPQLPWRLIGAGAGVLAVVGILFSLRHDAYRDGQDERTAYYEPILEAVRDTAARAEERAKAAEQAAATINVDVTNEDKKRAEDAIRQRDAAVVDLGAMRVRLASAIARRCEVPSVPGGTGSPDATTRESERAAEADRRLTELARQCHRDSDRLRGWQDWYRRQSAVTTSAAQPALQNP